MGRPAAGARRERNELDLVGYDEETDPEQAVAVGLAGPPAAVLLLLQRRTIQPRTVGLRLAGADIRGRLDLDDLQPPCRLRLGLCRLADGLTLDNARIPGLSLEGWRLNGHEDSYAVSAVGATITGQLSLSGATLTNEGGMALTLETASIGGGAFLDEGFTATGAVSAGGATITGPLILGGATLTNEGGNALTLDSASIGGGAFLDQGFTATGAVHALGAAITGQLILSGATLTNEGGTALTLDSASIGGGAFLDQGFTATGAVSAIGATITGQLSLSGATLTNEGGNALTLDRASIGGGAFLDEGFTATGAVSAPGATITGQLSLRGATLTNEGGTALTLDRASISDALLDGGSPPPARCARPVRPSPANSACGARP